jgi:osmotically-inducible protein OsmY
MLAPALARIDSSHRQAAVERQLRQTGHPDLQHVQLSESAGCVHRRGTVQSFFAKQMAQVVAASVPGVTLIRNELSVKKARRRG